MLEFVTALNNPQIPFLRYAFLAGLIASVAFGVIGSYVVAKRITYIAGAISHCVLGGIGAGLYAQSRGITWLDPIVGALITALLAALVIGLVSIHASEREDTVIGALWSIGMAVGLLFIASTPGYIDPMSYLFGNILLVSQKDLWLIGGLDLVVVGVGWFLYNNFLAVCFDEEYARIRGLNTSAYYLTLLCLTALTIVLLVRVVGIVMVVALLTLPAAIAGHFARGLWQMMVLAALLCMVFVSGGLAASYSLNLPAGPVIIIFAGAVYLCVAVAGRLRSR
jgi:zinc transport system permease protein